MPNLSRGNRSDTTKHEMINKPCFAAGGHVQYEAFLQYLAQLNVCAIIRFAEKTSVEVHEIQNDLFHHVCVFHFLFLLQYGTNSRTSVETIERYGILEPLSMVEGALYPAAPKFMSSVQSALESCQPLDSDEGFPFLSADLEPVKNNPFAMLRINRQTECCEIMQDSPDRSTSLLNKASARHKQIASQWPLLFLVSTSEISANAIKFEKGTLNAVTGPALINLQREFDAALQESGFVKGACGSSNPQGDFEDGQQQQGGSQQDGRPQNACQPDGHQQKTPQNSSNESSLKDLSLRYSQIVMSHSREGVDALDFALNLAREKWAETGSKVADRVIFDYAVSNILCTADSLSEKYSDSMGDDSVNRAKQMVWELQLQVTKNFIVRVMVRIPVRVRG